MAAPDGRNRPAGEQESSLAAALAEERKAHGVAKRDLAEALSRNAALEGEIAELAEEALTRLEEVSVIASRSERRAEEAEAALRRERNAAMAKAALAEADEAFEQRLMDRKGRAAERPPTATPPSSPASSPPPEGRIAAAASALRKKVADCAARRLASRAAASGDVHFGSLVAAAASAASGGGKLSDAVRLSEEQPARPPSPMTPIGRSAAPRWPAAAPGWPQAGARLAPGPLLRKSSSETALSLPAVPGPHWVNF